jgi:hypothetical protein
MSKVINILHVIAKSNYSIEYQIANIIASVFRHAILPRFALDLVPDPRRKGVDVNYNTHLAMESNRETDKADGFADDNSTATLANLQSLETLKNIISDFANFSGLMSNVEKTMLMQIGTQNELSDELKISGLDL